MEEEIRVLLEKLKKDKVKNIMTIDSLERGLAIVLLKNDNTLIVKTDEALLVHSCEKNDFNLIVEKVKNNIKKDEFVFILVHDEWLAEDLREALGFKEIIPYLNSLIEDDVVIEEVTIKGLEIRQLTQDDFNFVRRTYKLVASDGYIRERIDHGMLGAVYNGNLVGFVGEHDEGTMGMLEVIPEARRLGIAKALSNEMIKLMRKNKRYAHSNTSPNNEASIQLQKQHGFTICYDPVYWLFR